MHELNIFIHVLSGSIALLLGLAALLSSKGGKTHNRSGNYFLGLMAIVILSGLAGVFIFGRNSFLLVVTILAAYNAFSGFRAIRKKSNQAHRLDIMASLISLIVLLYYLYYFKQIGMFWSGVITYSTVGALLLVITYDCLRYLIPPERYVKNRIWLYEHIYKMTSAFAALLAAFSGTVFEKHQPHSQYLPSVLGLLIIFGFMWRVYQQGLKNKV